MNNKEIEAEAGKVGYDYSYCFIGADEQQALTNRVIALCLRVRESDAQVCDLLEGEGDKPTDRIIGYRECADAIRSQGGRCVYGYYSQRVP